MVHICVRAYPANLHALARFNRSAMYVSRGNLFEGWGLLNMLRQGQKSLASAERSGELRTPSLSGMRPEPAEETVTQVNKKVQGFLQVSSADQGISHNFRCHFGEMHCGV